MLGECVRDSKNEAARPESTETRGERAVEVRKPCGGCGTAAAREGLERRIEVGTQIEATTDMAKLDDVGTDRERRQQLRALQRLRRIRQYREPAVHAIGPIIGSPRDRAGNEAIQVAQGQCEQPARPKCR